MAPPDIEDVRTVLEPYEATIIDIIRQAWRDWIDSGFGAVWEFKRNRANFVWAQMAHYAREVFGGEPDVHIVEKDETLKFLVDDRVLFRLKKGDEVGLTANIPTQQVLAYHDHDQDLFGLPEVQRVDVTYILNRLETEIGDILVVARDGKQLVWTYSILDGAQDIEPLPLPPERMPPEETPGRRMVKAKPNNEGRKKAAEPTPRK